MKLPRIPSFIRDFGISRQLSNKGSLMPPNPSYPHLIREIALKSRHPNPVVKLAKSAVVEEFNRDRYMIAAKRLLEYDREEQQT